MSRVPLAPGRVYYSKLVCGLCDYSLEIAHHGPDYDRGVFDLTLRECPQCKQRGITSFMERSNK